MLFRIAAACTVLALCVRWSIARSHAQPRREFPSLPQAALEVLPGQVEKREQHYRQALQLGSHVADAHYNLGVLLASVGQKLLAAEAFRQAVGADPFHVRAHNNLGALLAEMGKREEAVEQYRRALASDPQHAASRFGLGAILLQMGRAAEAVEQLQKLPLGPDSPETPRYRFALASAWYASGETAKAIDFAEQAAREAMRFGQRELLATIERQLKRMKVARR